MRGGRNRFGPLYRRDRQMKQQKAFQQTNTAPYRIKMETSISHQPLATDGPHPISPNLNASLSSSTFQQCRTYHSSITHAGISTPWDCIRNADRGLTPPSLPYTGLLPQVFPEYPQEKSQMPFGCSSAYTNYPVHTPASECFTSRGTPASSANPSVNPLVNHASSPSPGPSSATLPENFLNALLESEQDESQLCAKVLASLQREQANRGKHDRLNTFSIMCKMADQTLFGLVEWARNSALFKELKVKNQENV